MLHYAPRPDQERLAAVNLAADGRPLSHPWFASRVGRIVDAQLVAVGERVHAVYRIEQHVESVDITNGRWGATPRGTVAHGPPPPGPLLPRVHRGAIELHRVSPMGR